MKPLPLLFIFLILSCAKENEPTAECKLAKIVVKGKGFVNQTSYTYNSAGQMETQVRTSNGVTVFDYTYSYNLDGKVDKVNMVDHFIKFQYSTDGKFTNVTIYSNNGELTGNELYYWKGNTLEIIHTKPGLRNIYQISEFEFQNDNIVREMYETYTGNDPNVLISQTERRYENFDTALSAFYIASSSRPGYREVSKNNPRKRVEMSTVYIGGSDPQVTTYTTDYSYTYNDSKATITVKAISNSGLTVEDTEIIYDQCN